MPKLEAGVSFKIAKLKLWRINNSSPRICADIFLHLKRSFRVVTAVSTWAHRLETGPGFPALGVNRGKTRRKQTSCGKCLPLFFIRNRNSFFFFFSPHTALKERLNELVVRLITLHPQIISHRSDLNRQRAVAVSLLIGNHLGNEFGLSLVLPSVLKR